MDKADADHLMAALHAHYQVTKDWAAQWYCGKHSSRTMLPEWLICPCLGLLTVHLNASTTHIHNAQSMHHMLGKNQIMVPPHNMHRTQIPHQFWMQPITHGSRRSLECYHIIPEPWFQLCWLPLAPWPPSKAMGHKPPWKCAPSF